LRHRPLRVCIVTTSPGDRSFAAGVDLAALGLAEALSKAGHAVTLVPLSIDNGSGQDGLAEWRTGLDSHGVHVAPLPERAPVPIDAYAHPALAYRVFLWLREHSFDVVHFPDRGGYGYYSMLAKRQGLAFAKTLFCVRSDGPTLWAQSFGFAPSGSIEDLTADFMERQSLALADAVVGSSNYILSWLDAQGWRLPHDAFVCGPVLPHQLRRQAPRGGVPVREIVFVAHLERQGDLNLFLNAIDLLARHSYPDLQVTFLSTAPLKEKRESVTYVARRIERWKGPSRVIADFTWSEAVAYLNTRPCVTVVGLSMCGVPCRVLSLIAAGAPTLVPAVYGMPEHLPDDARSRNCFDPWPAALAKRLEDTLEDGARSLRPAAVAEATEDAWLRWHEVLGQAIDDGSVTPPPVTTAPLVSVCMTHHNRPRYLAQALKSVREQDYPRIEVVLVDDGSTQPEAVRYLDELEGEFASRRWRIVRQDNRFPGAARNTAVKHSTGEYLLFMDDDNYAKPNEIATFVAVAQRTEADILTCFSDTFAGDDPPDPTRLPLNRAPALGPAVAFGVFHCGFGNTNGLVKREAFNRIGGFAEDYGLVAEDHEFLARAVLSGLKLETIPEALWWYRTHGESILNITDRAENQIRVLRPYLKVVRPELQALLLYTLGQFLSRETPRLGAAQWLYTWRGMRRGLRAPDRAILFRRFARIVRMRGLRAALRAVARFAAR
jgi:glycosyltransferase involved in cell wall biosynthesis